MRLAARLRAGWLAACLALTGALAQAAEPGCRIAFDVGSSGIRAGMSRSEVSEKAASSGAVGKPGKEGQAKAPQADIDYLSPQWAGQGLAPVIAPTVAALRELPEKSGFPADCARVGAGFSAWRLALKQDDAGTAEALAQIREQSGVPVLVIPQPVEGRYGYAAARALLAGRLETSHVLDIGGGSLQIAGEQGTFGIDLGQKAWHRLLCQRLRPASPPDCGLQPMSRRELAKARALLAEELAGAAAALPPGLTLTAISRPVTRGVFPAVARLTDGDAATESRAAASAAGSSSTAAVAASASGRQNRLSSKAASLTRTRLTAAIARLAAMPADEALRRLGTQPRYLTFLLSDLLLVEGILDATRTPAIAAADVDLTNLPALLADDQAYAWGERYGCYLARLKRWGAGAYYTDPASCPAR